MVNPAAFTFPPAEAALFLDDVSVHIDLHQIGRTHLVEIHAVLIDQEMMLGSRQAGAEMGVDEVRPAMVRHQPIERGQIAANLPLGRGHAGDRRRRG